MGLRNNRRPLCLFCSVLALLSASVFGVRAFANEMERLESEIDKEVSEMMQDEPQVVVAEPRSRSIIKGPAKEKSRSNESEGRRSNGQTQGQRLFGINVFAFFSSADRLRVTGRGDQVANLYGWNGTSQDSVLKANLDGEYRSNATGGVGIEHSRRKLIRAGPVGFGFDVGGTYELEREIFLDRIYGYNPQQATLSTDGVTGLSLFVPYANVNVAYRGAYGFVGANYSIPSVSGGQAEAFEGQVGMQVGGGGNITEWLSIEASYRWLNLRASPTLSADDLNYYGWTGDRNTVNGLGLLGTADLSLNGINIAVKMRF